MDIDNVEARFEALEARVQEFEDKEEIRNLRYSYHQRINDDRFDLIAELFTEDALVDIGYVMQAKGRAEIAAAFEAMPGGVKFLKQFIHNHIVDVTGDTATGQSYFEAKYAALDETSLLVAGKYNEDYVRTGDGWRISRMVIDLYFTTPLDKGWAIDNPHFMSASGKIGQREAST